MAETVVSALDAKAVLASALKTGAVVVENASGTALGGTPRAVGLAILGVRVLSVVVGAVCMIFLADKLLKWLGLPGLRWPFGPARTVPVKDAEDATSASTCAHVSANARTECNNPNTSKTPIQLDDHAADDISEEYTIVPP